MAPILVFWLLAHGIVCGVENGSLSPTPSPSPLPPRSTIPTMLMSSSTPTVPTSTTSTTATFSVPDLNTTIPSTGSTISSAPLQQPSTNSSSETLPTSTRATIPPSPISSETPNSTSTTQIPSTSTQAPVNSSFEAASSTSNLSSTPYPIPSLSTSLSETPLVPTQIIPPTQLSPTSTISSPSFEMISSSGNPHVTSTTPSSPIPPTSFSSTITESSSENPYGFPAISTASRPTSSSSTGISESRETLPSVLSSSVEPRPSTPSHPQFDFAPFLATNGTAFVHPKDCQVPNCHLALSITSTHTRIFYAGMDHMDRFILFTEQQGKRSSRVVMCFGNNHRCFPGIEFPGADIKINPMNAVVGELKTISSPKEKYLLSFSTPILQFDRETKFVFRIPVRKHQDELHLPEKNERVFYPLFPVTSSQRKVLRSDSGEKMDSIFPKDDPMPTAKSLEGMMEEMKRQRYRGTTWEEIQESRGLKPAQRAPAGFP